MKYLKPLICDYCDVTKKIFDDKLFKVVSY